MAIINQIRVIDERETDSNWLGAIRGTFGNVQQSIITETSTDAIVKRMYTDALIKAGLYTDEKDVLYRLLVKLNKFDCSYYWLCSR